MQNNILFDNTAIELNLSNIVNILPLPMGIKDKNAKYVAANMELAKLTGFEHPSAMIGITDADLKCSAAEYCHVHQREDKLALSAQTDYRTFNVFQYVDNKIHTLIANRKKIIDELNREFIFIFTLEIPIKKISRLLTFMDETRQSSGNDKFGSYIIDHQIQFKENKSLTERQAECLFYLIRGKTVKEISRILKISSRTVETHIESIKNNYHCHTKSELIGKAFEIGFSQVIPPSLLSNYI